MTDILREVDDAMKAERMSRLWQEHGKTIIALIVLVIVATAANSAWVAWKNNRDARQTTQLIEALTAEHPESKLPEAVKGMSGPLKSLTALKAAGQALKAKNYADAIKLYTDIAADKSAPQDIRDLATVQKVAVQLDQSKEATAESLLADLAPITNTKNESAWRLRALMLSALVKAHKSEDYKGALEDLALLSAGKDVPPTLAAQASALKAVYETKAGSKK